jgi:hypothetical protein
MAVISERRFGTTSGPLPISVDLLTQTYTSILDAPVSLGSRVITDDGREFVFCEAGGTIAAGNPVQQEDVLSYLINADVDAAQAVGTVRMTGTGDFTAYTAGGLEGAVVYIDGATAAAGSGQQRFIRRVVDANTIEITEAWTTALTTGADYIVYRPFVVQAKAATQLATPGVAQVAIADGSFGFIQTKGLGHALIDGSQDALVANEVCTVGEAVAGTVQGLTNAATTADDIAAKVGVAVADVGTQDILAPVFISPSGSF